MDVNLLAQLKTWNPWWQQGKEGIQRYKDPDYKRELYQEVLKQFNQGNQIISIVGMRQVGKSTIMRQLIKELLENNIDPKRILYISFDDPYLRINYKPKEIFELVIKNFSEGILGSPLENLNSQIYLFLDEIHQLPDWEKILKGYYDRSFPIKYIVSGSSSLRLQTKNRESLLGRISEHTLWPFSFREYVEYRSNGDHQLLELIASLRSGFTSFIKAFELDPVYKELEINFNQLTIWHKEKILNCLKQFIVCGGFPRAWQQPDFVSRQRFLWEQHVGKVVFEDLVQVANIRKPKDLEFLFARIVDFNGGEVKLTELQSNMKIHWETLDRYLSYLIRTFLVFRVDKTKTRRLEIKRRSGNVKFYLTDVALRNALYKKDEEVFNDPDEMGLIAENLVCTAIQRWLIGPRKNEQISFYKDRSGEIDFVLKNPGVVIPIEVKWRNDLPSLKTLDKITREWNIRNSILVTKDSDLNWSNNRLSTPLWFFLMAF